MDTGKLDSLFNNMAQQLTPEHMEKMLSELNINNDSPGNNQEDNDEQQHNMEEDQYNVNDNDFDIDSDSDISDLSAHEMEKVIIKDINVMVSSLDRDWHIRTDEDIYSFQVHLGTNYNNTDFTKVGDDEIFTNNNFLTVNYKFKNVVSVALERLILDNRKFNIEYTDVNRDFADYPYLSVSVDNLDSLVYGTNETSSKALGIMVAKTPIMVSGLGGCAHYEFTNIISNPKQFYNNPLASLNKLNINIKNPTGQVPNTVKDVLTVSKFGYHIPLKTYTVTITSTGTTDTYQVTGSATSTINLNITGTGALNIDTGVTVTFSHTTGYAVGDKLQFSILSSTILNSISTISGSNEIAPGGSNTTKEFITIQTSTYFYEEEFKEGDIIQLKNFDFADGTFNNATQFKEFINRKEGHRIINTANSDSDSSKLHNFIRIPVPQEINRTTVNLKQYPTWYDDGTGNDFESSGDFKSDTETLESATSGKLINVSNQTNLLFKVKIMDKESQFMTSLV
jgi:hypothetical protein